MSACTHYSNEITVTGSVQLSLVVLLDIENMRIAVGMLLLSCVQAEIYVVSYLLQVSGLHTPVEDASARSLLIT